MGKLELFGRPWKVFDPENREHRYFYYEFVKTGTWSRCPYRFVITDDRGDLITMIQRSLLKYYSEREFGNGKKQLQMMLQKNNRILGQKTGQK